MCKISMVLAALAFVGCSSEDLNEFTATPAVEDSNLIQLGSDFVLAGVGADGTTTRTHWDTDATTGAFVNQFLPIWASVPTTGNAIYDNTTPNAKLDEQEIGLCWLGNGAVGTDVYTNYEFYHFGWLNNGETAADLDKCGSLYNGALYDEITVSPTSNDAPNGEADKAGFTGYTIASGKAGTPSADLNFNSGVYKTENKAIFGGQYIVYYPYNKDFTDAGTIPAVAETNWTNVPTDWKSAKIGKETFRYSAPVTIEGGYQAANFGLYNLSAIAQLRVASVAGDPCVTGTQTIDQIVLYSASKKLLKQANLAADKIAAGATGADLYAATEGTKTIVTTFAAAQTLLAKESTTITSAYITVLPTTVDDLVALVHNTNGKWAQISLGNTEFKAGSAKRLDIIVKDADFTTDFIAVDQASLTASLTAADGVVTADPTARPQITVIGDITLAGTYDITTSTYTNSDKITIKGDDIIVPENVTLNLETNMESEVRVLGTSCCSGAPKGGRVDVKGGTISNVTMEPTEARVTPLTYDALNPEVKYSAAATVAAGKTVNVKAGNVIVNQAVEHKGDIVVAENAKVTVNGTAGDLQFMGSNVTNNGTIEVMKNGKFDMTDANGNASATDGQRMTNNGTFIHNVDAGVGTAVQSMVQNGEYRCKVNDQIKLDDAFLQWTACSVIEMVNTTAVSYNLGTAADITPTAYKHNGNFIDIEVNSGTVTTTFNNPGTTNGDSKVIEIGNLTVLAGGLDIDYVQGTGKRTLTVNGNMDVAVNTTITDSKLIDVKGNVTVEGDGVSAASAVSLYYKGEKKNEDGFKVAGDITVSGATFKAGNISGTSVADVDALNITCANFYLKKIGTIGGVAEFANRTDGAAKNLVVSGTISNPEDCSFNIKAAGQYTDPNGNTSVLAWVTCKTLEVGGTFSAARPRVVQ